MSEDCLLLCTDCASGKHGNRALHGIRDTWAASEAPIAAINSIIGTQYTSGSTIATTVHDAEAVSNFLIALCTFTFRAKKLAGGLYEIEPWKNGTTLGLTTRTLGAAFRASDDAISFSDCQLWQYDGDTSHLIESETD
jgi:hypothetical protein